MFAIHLLLDALTTAVLRGDIDIDDVMRLLPKADELRAAIEARLTNESPMPPDPGLDP